MPGQLNLAGSRPPASGLDVDWTQIDRRKFLSYGSISVFLVRFLVFPFSLVKTRMQTGRTGSQRVFKTIGEIASKEGFRALYSGFSVSIFGAIPAQLVYISAYELVKSKVANLAAEGKLGVGTDEAARALVSNLMGGAAASLASQVVVVPVDVVAQRLMIQTRNPAAASPYPYYPTSFHALRHILQVEGASGLYRGFFSSLITYMPSSAIWWASNALARRHLNYWIYGDAGGLQQPEDDEQEGHPWNEMDLPPRLLSRPPRDLAVLALSGIFAGLTSAMLTNPLDVLKTRIQTSALPFSTVLKNLLATEGPWGLARGVRARMLSTVPTSTLLIFSYEVVKSLSVRVD